MEHNTQPVNFAALSLVAPRALFARGTDGRPRLIVLVHQDKGLGFSMVAADCTGEMTYEETLAAAFQLLQDENSPSTRTK